MSTDCHHIFVSTICRKANEPQRLIFVPSSTQCSEIIEHFMFPLSSSSEQITLCIFYWILCLGFFSLQNYVVIFFFNSTHIYVFNSHSFLHLRNAASQIVSITERDRWVNWIDDRYHRKWFFCTFRCSWSLLLTEHFLQDSSPYLLAT